MALDGPCCARDGRGPQAYPGIAFDVIPDLLPHLAFKTGTPDQGT